MGSICLIYHEIRDEREAEDGCPYSTVTKAAFREHLAVIRAAGGPVRTVAELVQRPDGDCLVLTFDDGWRGALTHGLECLLEVGCTATYFVTTGYLGRGRFADAALLRRARAAGMEIGAHGVTHRYLSGCSETELRAEFADAKQVLEDVLGEAIHSASVPGGEWTPLIGRIAQECGYTSLCTSVPGLNRASTKRHCLRRMRVGRAAGPREIGQLCGRQIGREVLRYHVLRLAKRLLGIERYAALRRRVLGDKADFLTNAEAGQHASSEHG